MEYGRDSGGLGPLFHVSSSVLTRRVSFFASSISKGNLEDTNYHGRCSRLFLNGETADHSETNLTTSTLRQCHSLNWTSVQVGEKNSRGTSFSMAYRKGVSWFSSTSFRGLHLPLRPVDEEDQTRSEDACHKLPDGNIPIYYINSTMGANRQETKERANSNKTGKKCRN